jgi:glutaminase
MDFIGLERSAGLTDVHPGRRTIAVSGPHADEAGESLEGM